MNSYLAPKMSSFCVANLRNSQLLRAIRALNLNILDTIYFAQNKSEVPWFFIVAYERRTLFSDQLADRAANETSHRAADRNQHGQRLNTDQCKKR
jgi:hypothetical protein